MTFIKRSALTFTLLSLFGFAHAGVVEFNATTFSTNEITTPATITLKRIGDSTAAASVLVSVTGGTAVATSDYTFTPATVSWAAGDATSRAVRLADMSMRGEMGIPGVLTAPQWGFYDVSFSHTNADLKLKEKKDREFKFQRDYGSYVMENILFKISFPAEFHSQTACEAAVRLHPEVKDRLDEIEKIVITTHESAIRIISKEGTLANPADRDHCLQYMTAVPLIFGNLVAEHYENDFHAANPLIDELRSKMEIREDKRYSKEYHDPDKRSIANAIQVFFKDGSSTDKVEIEYPIGHRRRRDEGIPVLEAKFQSNLATRFPKGRSEAIFSLCKDADALHNTPVNEFMDMFVI